MSAATVLRGGYMILLKGGGHDLTCAALECLTDGLKHRSGEVSAVVPLQDADGECCVCLEPTEADA